MKVDRFLFFLFVFNGRAALHVISGFREGAYREERSLARNKGMTDAIISWGGTKGNRIAGTGGRISLAKK